MNPRAAGKPPKFMIVVKAHRRSYNGEGNRMAASR